MSATRARSKPAEKPEELVEELEGAASRVRDRARFELGITGESKTIPLRQLFREDGARWYPMVAIFSLGMSNYFQGYAYLALVPDIARTLGIGIGTIAALGSLVQFAETLSPFPMAWLTQSKPRRALLCLVTGLGWGLATLYTGFVTGLLGLMAVLLLDGISTGSVRGLHIPLLMDNYPPRSRVRAVAAYFAFGNVGVPFVVSAIVVTILTGPLHLTWRGVFVVLGFLSLFFAAIALRLKDPGFGRFDTDKVRRAVREAHGEKVEKLPERDVRPHFWEVVRRILMVPTLRRLLVGALVIGIFSIPLNYFISFFMDEKFGLGPTGRGLVFAASSFTGVIALALFGKRTEGLQQKDPAKIPVYAAILDILAVLAFGLSALMPNLPSFVVVFCLGFAFQIIGYPMVNVMSLSLVDSRFRAHAAAVVGVSIAIGGILGSLFLSGVAQRFGVTGALVALTIPGFLSALIVLSARRYVNQDFDRMIDGTVEEEEIERIRASGGRLPMLACRNIDFSYGQLQVLFDVDFTVDDGEMVALLGVNGAGKSTLLKVISGIGLPTRGSVRLSGEDVTFLDAERRLRLGIAQVPGGRAVFPPLSVVDNLRVYGYALEKNGESIDQAIERCFQAFPQLAERRNQLANTLSGGEQQMLGLCKAVILRPRLLLIDELSLGLAPLVVTRLLEMVREINAAGTAVVLVEQSATVALSVAHHAYFMEKGEIRFDGPSKELLRRKDLLRAVFLKGAGAKG